MRPKPRYVPANVTQILNPEDAPDITVYLYQSPKNNKPCALAYRGNQSKPLFNYAFPSEAGRLAHLNDQRKMWAYSWNLKAQYKAKRAAPSELQVGDIVYTTWGYEQTNVDFYEVVEMSKSRKSATIQHLKTTGEYDAHFMTGTASALPGQYNGPAQTFRTVGKDRINTEHSQYAGSARKWDGLPIGYSSYG